jgi:hypothetical protein
MFMRPEFLDCGEVRDESAIYPKRYGGAPVETPRQGQAHQWLRMEKAIHCPNFVEIATFRASDEHFHICAMTIGCSMFVLKVTRQSEGVFRVAGEDNWAHALGAPNLRHQHAPATR